MDLGIAGRTAIVTGSSKGIGKAIASTLVDEGCQVAICARDSDELRAAADDIGEDGNVLAVETDVTDFDDVERLVDETRETFGSIDILVNNVGTTGSFEHLDAVPHEEWENVIETNVYATAEVTRQVLPDMREQGWGRIINVASDAGIMPHAEMPQYNASKAAMINMTKSFSKSYGDEGVLVNAIAPPTTRTPLVEEMFEEMADERGITTDEAEQRFLDEEKPQIVFDRVAEPEEVSGAVAFLASEQASYITGATYRIDGGGIPTIDT